MLGIPAGQRLRRISIIFARQILKIFDGMFKLLFKFYVIFLESYKDRIMRINSKIYKLELMYYT